MDNSEDHKDLLKDHMDSWLLEDQLIDSSEDQWDTLKDQRDSLRTKKIYCMSKGTAQDQWD